MPTQLVKSDEQLTKVMSGRYWLPFGVYTTISPMSADDSPYAATIDRTIVFKRWTQQLQVETTNSGSHYWKIEMYRIGFNDLIATMNTSAESPGTISLSTTTFSITSVTTTTKGIYVFCSKVGSPGNLYIYGPSLEVEV